MKKKLCVLLCAILFVSLFAGCSPAAGSGDSTTADTSASKLPHALSVGFGRADITPTESLPLDGLTDTMNRWSEGVKDRIYATCVAFTDENGNTVIHFSIEMLYAYVVTMQAKADIAKKTGVPFANIMIGTTHSHSSPAVNVSSQPAVDRYNEMLRQKMVEAAEMALADRKPAKMLITTVYPENINSIRHYKMADGTYAGDNFGKFSNNTIVDHVREVDNALQLVKFTREGAKDIIMMNWQGHPSGHGDHRYQVMSWACTVTDTVEQGLDCHCIYVLGASGNVNNSSRIPEEKIYKTYEERAAALGKYVVEADGYQEVEVGNVQILAQTAELTPKNGGNNKVNMNLNAFSIGDVALVTAPYEMYCENGEAVKEQSPFKMTFVSSCSNGRGSYIPSISTYDYNNMPDVVYGITKTEYAPGAAEILENAFVSMLNELYKTKN